MELLYESFEGHFLVFKSSECHFSHARKQFMYGKIAREPCAHNERVDKKADEGLDLAAVAIGNGNSHHNILLTSIAKEQYLVSSQQRHKGCEPFLLAASLDTDAQRRGEREEELRAAKLLNGWPGAIRRQL